MYVVEKNMDIYQFLRDNQVSYQSFEHPPVLTIEEANQLDIEIPGLPTKNLFLRDGKGKKHWLWLVLMMKTWILMRYHRPSR
ncbi:aminoacyl-tRNA editing enzymes ybaK [Vibrio ishigakensis]|uniref:Aminoacyl-tRNA editing enzymes ybaK n=1 Tax=Vibrio ishigakensis TaxID=1481914 RepID=A0A0B8QV38_9VIBR|nr:aminoacyl-tRNA editing enzymes ybaK [Vibrio ishigakensis]